MLLGITKQSWAFLTNGSLPEKEFPGRGLSLSPSESGLLEIAALSLNLEEFGKPTRTWRIELYSRSTLESSTLESRREVSSTHSPSRQRAYAFRHHAGDYETRLTQQHDHRLESDRV